MHYVPVKEDLSDLYEMIRWCQENDDKCQQIVKNASKFADKYLTEEGISDYLSDILNRIVDTN